jgi:DNA-binding beta-propeller fold protein YncE
MRSLLLGVTAICCACSPTPSAVPDAGTPDGGQSASLPLVLVADVPLPGGSTRFDYQDIDREQGHVIIAHMNDGTVDVCNLSDGSIIQVVPNVPTARGIVVADDVGLFFVSSSPNQLVAIDNKTLTEVRRVTTGNGPDGVGWDATDKIVASSDQSDGAISLIANAGAGTRTQIPLGTETGNVVYDAPRGIFWITVVGPTTPDRLVGVDPVGAKVTTTIPIPGCDGAHGLRIHPDGQSALIACENNDKLARVDLGGSNSVAIGSTGSGPDVLSIDPTTGWLYVAAESGDLTVFDIDQPGVVLVGHDSPGNNSHSVAADPATQRVFFPLMQGPNGTPVLRIMKPTGS